MTKHEVDALLQERAKLLADAKAELDLSAEANGGVATAESNAKVEQMLNDADVLHKKALSAKAEMDRSADLRRKLESAAEMTGHGLGRRVVAVGDKPSAALEPVQFGRHKIDPNKLNPIAFNGLKRRFEKEYQEAFTNQMFGEFGPSATFKWDTAAEGGIFVPPEFRREVIKELDEIFMFRQLARQLPPTERRVDFPRRTVRERRLIKGQSWSASGTDGKLGTASWEPYCFTGEVSVNKQLMAMGGGFVEGYVRDEIVYDVAATQENLFINGEGDQEPFGLFKAATNGLPTSADVSKATLNFDAFVDFRNELRDVYLRSNTVRLLCHRSFQTMLMKIKGTSNDHPLFQPSLTADVPDRFLGVPMMFSEFCPVVAASPASGDYIAVIGDFSNYWYIEGPNMTIERHDLETRSNVTSFLYRTWFDGNVAIPEAFKRLKKS